MYMYMLYKVALSIGVGIYYTMSIIVLSSLLVVGTGSSVTTLLPPSIGVTITVVFPLLDWSSPAYLPSNS